MAYPYEVVGAPVTPGKATIGGVLSVLNESGALKCTWAEVHEALAKGWVAVLYDGSGSIELIDGATVDESGSSPVYTITAGSKTFTCDAPGESPSSSSGDNTVGSAVVGTATAG
jgi:hypothetical protein